MFHIFKVTGLRSSNAGLTVIRSLSTIPSSFPDLETSVRSVEAKDEESSGAVIERGPLPILAGRRLPYLPDKRLPRQGWLDNLDTIEEQKLGLVDLHPDVFGVFPRIDVIQRNVVWQQSYRRIDWNWLPTKEEMKCTGKKPWRQKGLGKARHGSIKSPIWYHGEKAHGPRGPKSYFYMLPFYLRVMGLTSTLSVKFAQDDLKIVDTLDIPTSESKYLEDLAAQRHWGISVLYVDDTDIMPKNIALATESISHHNLMPVYGLNCHSMIKHETVVLTLAAVNKLEDRLLYWQHANDSITPAQKYTGQHSSGYT